MSWIFCNNLKKFHHSFPTIRRISQILLAILEWGLHLARKYTMPLLRVQQIDQPFHWRIYRYLYSLHRTSWILHSSKGNLIRGLLWKEMRVLQYPGMWLWSRRKVTISSPTRGRRSVVIMAKILDSLAYLCQHIHRRSWAMEVIRWEWVTTKFLINQKIERKRNASNENRTRACGLPDPFDRNCHTSYETAVLTTILWKLVDDCASFWVL